MPLRLLGGRGHYQAVVERVMEAERSVWIATANLKELMVEDRRARPGRRRTLRRRRGAPTGRCWRCSRSRWPRGGDPAAARRRAVAAVPGRAGAAPGLNAQTLRSGRRSPAQSTEVRGSFEMRLCPRVHFKAVIIDGAEVYLGSANWTGAGLGAKGEGRRNFELGVRLRDDLLLDEVQGLYDQVWRGARCGGCRLRRSARRRSIMGRSTRDVRRARSSPEVLSGLRQRGLPATGNVS